MTVPGGHDQTVVLFLGAAFLLLMAFLHLADRRKTAVFLMVVSLGAILVGISAWIYKGKASLSLAAQSLTVSESSLFRHSSNTYPLDSVKSSFVDVGGEGNKRLAFLMTNGETVSIDTYATRDGYENASFEVNRFLEASRHRGLPAQGP